MSLARCQPSLVLLSNKIALSDPKFDRNVPFCARSYLRASSTFDAMVAVSNEQGSIGANTVVCSLLSGPGFKK